MGGRDDTVGADPRTPEEAYERALTQSETQQELPIEAPESEERARDPETGKFVSQDEVDVSVKQLGGEDLVTIDYRGKPVTVPWNKARDLVQKGHDYEQKMSTMKQDRQSYDAWQAYRDYMVKNPELAGVIGDALETYEQTGVMPKFAADDYVADEGGSAPESAGNTPLERQVRQVTARLDEADHRQAYESYTQRLVQAVEANPVLASVSGESYRQTGRDLALEKLVQLTQPDSQSGAYPSEQDIAIAAEAASTEFAVLRGETLGNRPSQETVSEDPGRFITERPEGSPLPPSSQDRPSYSARDFKSGNLRGEAERFLAESLGNG